MVNTNDMINFMKLHLMKKEKKKLLTTVTMIFRLIYFENKINISRLISKTADHIKPNQMSKRI